MSCKPAPRNPLLPDPNPLRTMARNQHLPNPVPPKFLPYVNDPVLSRHLRVNNQGDIIQAKLCHDLFALPYDPVDIGKVPFNRIYRREKLLLIDNPVNRTLVIRQSLTNPNLRLETTTGKVIADSMNRIKMICSNNNPTQLDHHFDEELKSTIKSIEKTMPRGHSLIKRRHGGLEGKRKEELVEYQSEKDMVGNLDTWEKVKVLGQLPEVKQLTKSQKKFAMLGLAGF